MSLQYAPTFTNGTAGNLIASGALTHGATTTANFYVGVSGQSGAQGSITTGSAIFGRVQVWNTGGSSVTSGAYVQVQIFSTSDGTHYDTITYGGINFQIATVASTAAYQSFDLPPGQYQISLYNSDSTNSTTVEATLGTAA